MEREFFSRCKSDMSDCKIAFVEENKTQIIYDIPAISPNRFLTPNRLLLSIIFRGAMYFVSDREGGFGGLDIWLSVIDNDGNFGVPINAGSKINTPANEITPFYNKHDKMLYFHLTKKMG